MGGVSWGTGPDTEPPPNPKPSGSDGLVKLWTIKNNECVKTLDAHEDKVWGLHCNRLDDYALTGASDSCVILWKDVTETEQAEEQAKKEAQVVK